MSFIKSMNTFSNLTLVYKNIQDVFVKSCSQNKDDGSASALVEM